MRKRVWHASFFWPSHMGSSPVIESLYLIRHPVLEEAELRVSDRKPALVSWREIDTNEDPQAYRYAIACIEENGGEPMSWEEFVKGEEQ